MVQTRVLRRGILLSVLLAGSLATAAPAKAAQVWMNVQYESVNGVSVTANIARPDGGCPCPVIILVHGGGWESGSKANWGSDLTRLTLPEFGGFVVMAVDYRMACDPSSPPPGVPADLCGYHFPVPDQDVQASVDWAKARIAAYGGNPNRIVMLGSSSGAQIANMIATTGTGIDAAASWSGPNDFLGCIGDMCSTMENYVGCSLQDCRATWRDATVKTHVTRNTAPTYVANSDAESIPLFMATDYATALRNARVPFQLTVIPGSLHGKAYEDYVLPNGKTVEMDTAPFLLAHSQ